MGESMRLWLLFAVLLLPLSEGERPAPAVAATAPGHRIRLAYFVPKDRTPTANYERKIRIVMALVTELYLQDLRGKGYRADGLLFETQGGEPAVRLVRGDREAAHYNNAPAYNAVQQWQRLLPEIRAKVGDPQRQVIVVFAETYDSGPAAHNWPGVIARGAYNTADGGLAVFGAHLLRDEFSAPTLEEQRRLMFDRTPVPGRKAFGNPMNSPRGEFVEDGTGAVAHELGHALGLPHDHRSDQSDVMGNGFRNLKRNMGGSGPRVGFSTENARLLMASRYLSKELDLADNEPAGVEVTTQGRSVTVRATDNRGLRALVIVDLAARSVASGRALTGTTQGVTQEIPGSGPLRLQVIVADAGGNQTRKRVGAAAPDDD
jgi:hypothetical protein